LLRRSIDFWKTEVQPGDEPVPYFSYWKNDLWASANGAAENSAANDVPRGTSHTHPSHPSHPSHASHNSHLSQQQHTGTQQLKISHVEHSGQAGRYPPGSILDQIGGQLPCFITFTTDRTAAIIRENLHKSPMYSGVIEGVGPRYCPSIEDKIVKFPDEERQ